MTADGGAFLCAFLFFSFFVMKAILSFFQKLMTADGGLITRAGKCKKLNCQIQRISWINCDIVDDVFHSFRTAPIANIRSKLKVHVHLRCTLSHAPYVHDCADTPNPSVTL